MDIAGMLLDFLFYFHNMTELANEKTVDGSCFGYAVNACPETQQLSNGVDTVIGAGSDVFKQFSFGHAVELPMMQVAKTDLQRTHRFQQAFLHGSADAHDLAGRLHLGGKRVVGVCEFVKGKARHFCHHIVQCRLEGCRRIGKLDLIQRHAHANLRRYPGNGITTCFRGKGGGTGYPWIDLNEVILKGIRVESKLHVTSALDFQRADDFQCAVTEHMILLVRERLRRTNHNGIAGVDSNRVEVFHVADGDRRIMAVAHHFILDLFISLDAFFNQHLSDR